MAEVLDRQSEGFSCAQSELATWAQNTFNLPKPPSQSTLAYYSLPDRVIPSTS